VRAEHPDQHEVAHLGQLHAFDLHPRVPFAGIGVRVGAEVVHALEHPRGRGKGGEVQRVLDPPHERLAEGRAAARDLVEVRARDGRVARVELARDLLDPQQVDVGR